MLVRIIITLHLVFGVCGSGMIREFILDIERLNSLNIALETTVIKQEQIIEVYFFLLTIFSISFKLLEN